MKTNLKRTLAIMISLLSILALASCKAKKPAAAPPPLFAGMSTIFEDSGLMEYYRKDKDHFLETVAAAYGMGEADAKAFSSGEGNWGVYSLKVIINNNEQTNYTFTGFEADEFSPEGIWLSKESGNGEISIPAGVTGTQFPANIIVNLDKADAAKIYTAVSAMKLKIVYCPTPANDNIEPAADSFKKLTVQNDIKAPDSNNAKPEDEISVSRSNIDDGSDILKAYKSNDIAFSNESKLYGMDSETAAKVTKKSGKWECYTLNLAIENKTDSDLTVYSINTENNGENGVWVCSVSQYGEFGLPASSKQALPVSVLVDPKATGGKGVEEILKEMKLTVSYSPTAETQDGLESVVIEKIAEVK